METTSASDILTPTESAPVPTEGRRVTARALLIGDRIDTAGLERSDAFSTTPLAFAIGAADGFAAIFRYGVVVMIGLSPFEEDEVLRALQDRTRGAFAHREEESAILQVSADRDDQISPGGTIFLKALTPERQLIVADALAKSAALAHDEREVAAVFDAVEPFARRLAERGRAPTGRRAILRLIGQSLLVQQRVSAGVAVEEKPDLLWDRPDLERLYARLEDEYELKERAITLRRKLAVVGETATAMTDLIDTSRSLRLEVAIVLLIVFEVVITLFQMATGTGGH